MSLRAELRHNCLDTICVSLAGRATEALVFGENACTTGAEGLVRFAGGGRAQCAGALCGSTGGICGRARDDWEADSVDCAG